MNVKQEILNLKDGEVWVWPESDYGKAEVWLKNNIYFLFEIPSFGGEPQYVGAYTAMSISNLIATVGMWS